MSIFDNMNLQQILNDRMWDQDHFIWLYNDFLRRKVLEEEFLAFVRKEAEEDVKMSEEVFQERAHEFLSDTGLDQDALASELLTWAYENGHADAVVKHLKKRKEQIEAAGDGT